MEEEVWRDIEEPGGVSHYQISSLGRVKRLPYTSVAFSGGKFVERHHKEKLIKCRKRTSDGYVDVTLYLGDGRKRTVLVHRLVANTFLPAPSEELIKECLKCGFKKPCINHIDGNKENNNVENLEWCTYSYNNDRVRKVVPTGEENGRANLNKQDVMLIIALRNKGQTIKEIAENLGVPMSTIGHILCGDTWTEITGILGKTKKCRARTKQLSEK
ncbi:MAG: NUMOD4 domain-containing protein [Succinivibrio sp.]